MNERLRWGILGTGNIARQFADGVLKTAAAGSGGGSARGRSRITAVGSRSAQTAQTFAQAREIPGVHGSYESLLADPNVDAVYNSLPNSLHHAWTIKALRAGKHVLCEKPFAMTRSEAEEMFAEAAKAKRVLVEAFMYRSHPLTHSFIDAVRGGEIGELKMLRTSFCYKTSRIDGNVRFDRKLGGGGLMDVGCYCINFSRMLAGEEPTEVHASAHFHERGVDDLIVATLKFPSGVLASFSCGMSVHADNTAFVCGTDGYIEIPVPWKPPPLGAAYTIARSTPPKMDHAAGGVTPAVARPPRETRTVDAAKELYALEADDFAAAVLDGKPPALTAADTLGNMAVLDEIRRQIGLTF